MKYKQNLRGFTLVELMMVVTLLGILSAAGIGLYTNTLDDAKFDATYKEMLQLRKGLIGDLENTTIEGERIRFGYLGDMGGVPTTSQGLSAIYSLPAGATGWSVNTALNIGVGWNGPYVTSTTDADYSKDAWGRPYLYISDVGITPYILSYGSDGALGPLTGGGHAQDIVVEIPLSIRSSTVSGQIVQSGSAYSGSAYVEMFYPTTSGGLTSSSFNLTTSDAGQFTFSSVPFGIRSVRVKIPSSAAPLLTLGPIVLAVDNQNYFIPSNRLEVNPSTSDSNCNTVTTAAYKPATIVLDDDNSRVSFQLTIARAFSINTLYVASNVNALNKLEKIGIGGLVYGCFGALSHTLPGQIINRGFAECNGASKDINLNTTNNLTLLNAWGIPAGATIEAFMDFKNQVSQISTLTDYVDMRLGCDTIRISCGAGNHWVNSTGALGGIYRTCALGP
jgi:prepilin-type N-terminal cleavage/methylation domain-containing protein